jgi:hypothetical protein
MIIIKKVAVIIAVIMATYLFCIYSWSGDKQMSEKLLTLQNIESSVSNGMTLQSVKEYLAQHKIEYSIEKSEDLTHNEHSKLDFNFSFRLVFIVPDKLESEKSSIVKKHTLITIYFNESSNVFRLESRNVYSSY